MHDDLDNKSVTGNECSLSSSALYSILDSNRDITAIAADVVNEAHRISQCEHVCLSSYRSTTNELVPMAWQSAFQPTTVSLKQKFMGEGYLENRLVSIPDLGPYNYRLRPDTVRMGFKSMIGIPITGRNGLLGVMECYSKEPSHFSEEMSQCLIVLARQTALVLDSEELEKTCKRLSIENSFMHELQKTDQLSGGLLLYRLGECLAALLEPSGLAVFGIEINAEIDILQEVLAKGFSMKDINLLKKAIGADFLEQLKQLASRAGNPVFLRHPAAGKLLYVVPVLWQDRLEGIVMYYWAKTKEDEDLAKLEQTVLRLIQCTTITLKRNALYHSFQRISFSDPLTQITNRRLFDYLLVREFTKARKHHLPLGLMLIDLDHFKQINDQYGHTSGDDVLRQFALLLKQLFRGSHITARYGGEEFAVIMPNTRLEDVIAVGEDLRKQVEQTPFSIPGLTLRITISIGIAAFYDIQRAAVDPVTLLQAADKALYKAKQEGRSRVVVTRKL